MTEEKSDKKINVKPEKNAEEVIELTESEKLLKAIATPTVEQIVTDLPETIALRKQMIADGLQVQYTKEMNVLKRHMWGRLVDCVKKEDQAKMAKETDESKWQIYLQTTCPPPNVGGNKRKYNERIRYGELIERSKNKIRAIQGEAAKQNVKLKNEV